MFVYGAPRISPSHKIYPARFRKSGPKRYKTESFSSAVEKLLHKAPTKGKSEKKYLEHENKELSTL